MPNLFKLKLKDNKSISKVKYGDIYGKIKIMNPANKEWFNSIYAFNKNRLKLLPVADKVLTSMIKNYFNIFYNKIEKTRSRRKDIITRRKSGRKIWFSRPEIKHTNSILTINIYIYNRQYTYLKHKLTQIWNYKNSIINTTKFYRNIFILLLKIKVLYIKLLFTPKRSEFNNKNYKLKPYLLVLKYFRKILKKEIKYLRFKQIMLFNKFKYNTYITGIKEIIQKIYNKRVEFNLITIKHHYLNSSILSQIITNKIRKKKNKAVRVLAASIRSIKTPVLNARTIKRVETKLIEKQNIIVSNFINRDDNDILDSSIISKNAILLNKDLEEAVLTNTNYKVVSGITVKASGRITRRIIAERARFNIKSKGTLKNVNSSFKGLSSVMMRGYNKSNIDSTFLKSTTHVGAFGVKGWISSY